MELRQLRYFVEIARAGSFSKASEQLNVAQPSLSQHVRNLEAELGVDLFARHARGVRLTPQGEALRDHANKILDDIYMIPEVVIRSNDNPEGEVNVGLPTSACRGLAIPLVQAVSAAHPGIRVHIVEAMTGSLQEWMEGGRVDVALLYDFADEAGFHANHVGREELALIAPPTLVKSSHPSMPIDAISRLPLALPGRIHVMPPIVRQIMETRPLGAERQPPRLHCDSLSGLLQLVKNGYGTFLPRFAVADEIERGEVIAVSIRGHRPTWTLSVVRAERSSVRAASVVVAKILEEQIRKLARTKRWQADITPPSEQANSIAI